MIKRILIPLVLLLAACDPTPTPSPPPQPQPETGRAPNPVFETQIQAVGKARAVEGQVMDAAEAQRKQIEDAEQQ